MYGDFILLGNLLVEYGDIHRCEASVPFACVCCIFEQWRARSYTASRLYFDRSRCSQGMPPLIFLVLCLVSSACVGVMECLCEQCLVTY